jgi:hypothetical protein
MCLRGFIPRRLRAYTPSFVNTHLFLVMTHHAFKRDRTIFPLPQAGATIVGSVLTPIANGHASPPACLLLVCAVVCVTGVVSGTQIIIIRGTIEAVLGRPHVWLWAKGFCVWLQELHCLVRQGCGNYGLVHVVPVGGNGNSHKRQLQYRILAVVIQYGTESKFFSMSFSMFRRLLPPIYSLRFSS